MVTGGNLASFGKSVDSVATPNTPPLFRDCKQQLPFIIMRIFLLCGYHSISIGFANHQFYALQLLQKT